MLRIIILAICAYVAWRYYGWPGAGVVVGAYVAFSAMLWVATKMSARGARNASLQHAAAKLSDTEKAHLAAVREHQQKMHEHKAQFDPELRKRS